MLSQWLHERRVEAADFKNPVPITLTPDFHRLNDEFSRARWRLFQSDEEVVGVEEVALDWEGVFCWQEGLEDALHDLRKHSVFPSFHGSDQPSSVGCQALPVLPGFETARLVDFPMLLLTVLAL